MGTRLARLLDNSPEITTSVNDAQPDYCLPRDVEVLTHRLVETQGTLGRVMDNFATCGKRVIQLEDRLKAITRVMNPELDFPETVTKQSFADFWRLRCKQIHDVSKVTANGDVE